MRFIKILYILLVLCICIGNVQGNVLAAESTASSDVHRKIAKESNKRVWQLLNKVKLSEFEEDEIIYSAFASSYHWSKVGTIVNKQRGEWLISRVYSKLANGESSLMHAKKCLNLTDENNPEFRDFDIAYAFEAMSRAYAILENLEKAKKYYGMALDASKKISKAEDKKLFLNDLKSGDWRGFTY